MPADKIVTCCYCGARAALVLRGRDRHELTCSSCGAPLHDLKMLRADHSDRGRPVKPSPVRGTRPQRTPAHDPRRRRKRRKGLGRRVFEEILDVVEDIFD